MNDWILYDVQDKIATVTINRPEKRNAMTYQMLFDFIETMARAGADEAARVVILPEPVGPVTSSRPRGLRPMASTTGGMPRLSSGGMRLPRARRQAA